MGDPEFKLRELIKRENLRVFTSNYALYGDLSRRVGDCLGSTVPTVATYERIEKSPVTAAPEIVSEAVPEF